MAALVGEVAGVDQHVAPGQLERGGAVVSVGDADDSRRAEGHDDRFLIQAARLIPERQRDDMDRASLMESVKAGGVISGVMA